MKRVIIGEIEHGGLPISAPEQERVSPGQRPITAQRWRCVEGKYFVLENFDGLRWQEVACLSQDKSEP